MANIRRWTSYFPCPVCGTQVSASWDGYEIRQELAAEINADLLAACKAMSYYFHCMNEDDYRRLTDMMGDPPPIVELDAAIAKGG
jgi:hypothetical protein